MRHSIERILELAMWVIFVRGICNSRMLILSCIGWIKALSNVMRWSWSFIFFENRWDIFNFSLSYRLIAYIDLGSDAVIFGQGSFSNFFRDLFFLFFLLKSNDSFGHLLHHVLQFTNLLSLILRGAFYSWCIFLLLTILSYWILGMLLFEVHVFFSESIHIY